MKIKCLNCQNLFKANERELNRKNGSKNRGRFCSISCSSTYGAKIRREKIEKNVKCSYCGKIFYKNKSKMKNSRSNLHFCCRDHKDKAQRVEFGLTEIHPDHYRDGLFRYRNTAFRHLAKKCICGFDKEELLFVHHKDGNRKNNILSNLEIVCPICHSIRHMVLKNNKWIFNAKKITPIERISELEYKFLKV